MNASPLTSWEGAEAYFNFADKPSVIVLILVSDERLFKVILRTSDLFCEWISGIKRIALLLRHPNSEQMRNF
jgi:hypothetical protein